MADTTDPAATGAAASTPKKKKPLNFKRIIVLNKPKAGSDEQRATPEAKKKDEDDGLNLFSRSKDYFDEFARDLESESPRSDKKPAVQASPAEEGHKLSDEPEPGSNPTPKRRRVTYDEYYENMDKESLERFERQYECYEDGYGNLEVEDDLVVYKPGKKARGKRELPSDEVSPRPVTTPPSTGSAKRTRLSPVAGVEDPAQPDLKQDDGGVVPASPVQATPTTPSRIVTVDDDSSDEPVPSTQRRAFRNTPAAASSSKPPAPIVLDDDDDFGVGPGAAAPPAAQQSRATSAQPYETEFASYIEAARLRKQMAAVPAADSPSPTAPGTSNDVSDPTIRIIVISRINRPGTMKPPMMKRRISQSMNVVRNEWTDRAIAAGIIRADERDGVFLTWKGAKIYGATTGISLGLSPAQGGRLDPRPHEEGGYSRGALLLEAWTEEDYQADQAEKERQRRRDRGDISDDDLQFGPGDDAEMADEPDEEKIRVVLKARDVEPLKTTAYASTTMDILIAAYRKQRGVPAERQISLFFDGDRLTEGTTVEDADIGDLETVEVHIK